MSAQYFDLRQVKIDQNPYSKDTVKKQSQINVADKLY